MKILRLILSPPNRPENQHLIFAQELTITHKDGDYYILPNFSSESLNGDNLPQQYTSVKLRQNDYITIGNTQLLVQFEQRKEEEANNFRHQNSDETIASSTPVTDPLSFIYESDETLLNTNTPEIAAYYRLETESAMQGNILTELGINGDEYSDANLSLEHEKTKI